ncbi:C-type lectin domain family 1 member B-like [Argopecten irradians]|uniref:C-type lectin domain family 1 member B-like n=1 Tax=Argopecten irradians TaxID=31199 RepID=UPI003723815A
MCIQAGTTYHCVKHGYLTTRCPQNWGRINDICFTVSLDQKTWEEAKEACADLGADLIQITNRYDYSDHTYIIYIRLLELTGYRYPEGKVWTGLNLTQIDQRLVPFLDLTANNDTEPCMGLNYTRERLLRGDYLDHVAANCTENNGYACQMRSTDHWP